MNILALLSHTELFGSLSEKSRKRIATIAVEKTLKKNQTLFLEGDKGHGIYLLVSGNIQLSKSNASSDRNVIIKSVRPGELFAEVILFESDKYPVTATAVKRSLVFFFPKNQFLSLLESGDFRNEFIHMLLRKQRYLTERLRSLITMDVGDKLFHYLGQHYGAKERIVPGIAKKDLAAAIDATPETLSRLLLRLKKNGTLLWNDGEIIIKRGFWDTFGQT